MKESLIGAYPPMLVVFLGLVLFSLEWVLARPWLIAFLGLGAVALIYLVVYLHRFRDQDANQEKAKERHRLIARWNKRKDHR